MPKPAVQRQEGAPRGAHAAPSRTPDAPAPGSQDSSQGGRQAGGQVQDLFFKVFHLGPAASAISRVDDGVFVDVNAPFLELAGYARDEVIGRSDLDLGLWSDPGQRDRIVRELRAKGAVHDRDLTLRRKDGTARRLVSSLQRVEVFGRDCILTTSIDVSERFRATEAERESRALFRRVFDASPVGIGIAELATGRIVEVNDEFCRILGCRRDDILDRTVDELDVLGRADEREALARRLRNEGSIHDLEVEITTRQGARVAALASFQLIELRGATCALAVLSDITRRKRAEAAEQESRSLFNKIFFASPAAVVITRLGDGHVVEVNDAWCQLTGYARDEAIGQTLAGLGLWADGGRRAAILEELHDRGALQDREIEVRRRSGDVRTALVSVQEMRVEGEPCLLSVLVDITERKLTENKLREAKEHAEEMARLKSTFLTNLTHEIRTPLTVILGFTSILRQGVRKEYARFVQLIERSGRRLLLMLDSMLDLAQLEAGTLRIEQRPYNLGDVVQSVLQILRPLAEDKGLRLDVVPPAERVYARLDHAVLTRVLNNVFDNAIKFTEAGSIVVSLEERGDWALIRIRDTGVGIDETFLPLVFEPFAQESTGLERTHQGSGLGLAVSRRLIELMGGRIEVESKKGRGSTFTIVLPREP